MKFGPVPASECVGAILAHAEPRLGFKKGRVLTGDDMRALLDAGIMAVVVARLDNEDVPEDIAARRIANALAGSHLRVSEAFTGRANLYAEAAGLLRVDAAALNALNDIDESITVATLPAFDPVQVGAMVATVKIIPYAAPGWAVAKAEAAASAHAQLSLSPFKRMSVALISTKTPGFKASLLEKNRHVTEERVHALGSSLDHHVTVAHDIPALTEALHDGRGDLVLIFGASANADRADVIPAAIVETGGQVLHVGMPVDPGNLLVLGALHGRPVIGLPGCARSPKRNGFDFVLERVCAGLPVTKRDITAMGAGGLLKEIPLRGQLRERSAISEPTANPRVAALILAAGRSTRMGANKLTMTIAGRTVLRHVIDVARDARLSQIIAVTGHDGDGIAQMLPPDIRRIHNPAFASGMASSLKAGLAALPPDAGAVLLMLGDMPAVRAQDIAKLIAAFDPDEGRGIIVPVHQGKRGHPVLFSRAYWPAMAEAEGDQGARQALIDNADAVCEVAIDHPGVLMDADTPESLSALRALMEP